MTVDDLITKYKDGDPEEELMIPWPEWDVMIFGQTEGERRSMGSWIVRHIRRKLWLGRLEVSRANQLLAIQRRLIK